MLIYKYRNADRWSAPIKTAANATKIGDMLTVGQLRLNEWLTPLK
jgi:hypothetical protein